MVKNDILERAGDDFDIGSYEVHGWICELDRYPHGTTFKDVLNTIIPSAGGTVYSKLYTKDGSLAIPKPPRQLSWDHIIFENDPDWLQFKLTYG